MDHKELDIHVQEYLSGENSAFDIIYEETKKSVYLSIYAIIKDQSLIEDLMQDTYMKAINSIEYYNIGTNFKAWISRIARNNALNLYNKRKKEEIVDHASNPHIYEKTESPNHLLESAMKLLEGQEKEIVMYRIILNYRFKDISEILDMPVGTVFWIYQKAITKIKKEL